MIFKVKSMLYNSIRYHDYDQVLSYFPRVSHWSANDTIDKAVNPGALYKSPGIYLMTEETSPPPKKTQIGDSLMKAV